MIRTNAMTLPKIGDRVVINYSPVIVYTGSVLDIKEAHDNVNGADGGGKTGASATTAASGGSGARSSSRSSRGAPPVGVGLPNLLYLIRYEGWNSSYDEWRPGSDILSVCSSDERQVGRRSRKPVERLSGTAPAPAPASVKKPSTAAASVKRELTGSGEGAKEPEKRRRRGRSSSSSGVPATGERDESTETEEEDDDDSGHVFQQPPPAAANKTTKQKKGQPTAASSSSGKKGHVASFVGDRESSDDDDVAVVAVPSAASAAAAVRHNVAELLESAMDRRFKGVGRIVRRKSAPVAVVPTATAAPPSTAATAVDTSSAPVAPMPQHLHDLSQPAILRTQSQESNRSNHTTAPSTGSSAEIPPLPTRHHRRSAPPVPSSSSAHTTKRAQASTSVAGTAAVDHNEHNTIGGGGGGNSKSAGVQSRIDALAAAAATEATTAGGDDFGGDFGGDVDGGGDDAGNGVGEGTTAYLMDQVHVMREYPFAHYRLWRGVEAAWATPDPAVRGTLMADILSRIVSLMSHPAATATGDVTGEATGNEGEGEVEQAAGQRMLQLLCAMPDDIAKKLEVATALRALETRSVEEYPKVVQVIASFAELAPVQAITAEVLMLRAIIQHKWAQLCDSELHEGDNTASSLLLPKMAQVLDDVLPTQPPTASPTSVAFPGLLSLSQLSGASQTPPPSQQQAGQQEQHQQQQLSSDYVPATGLRGAFLSVLRSELEVYLSVIESKAAAPKALLAFLDRQYPVLMTLHQASLCLNAFKAAWPTTTLNSAPDCNSSSGGGDGEDCDLPQHADEWEWSDVDEDIETDVHVA